MNVGISVSRVGGAAQVKAMKAVAGTLKIDLAQFRELEAFATFGSELDRLSQAQLDRGYRLTELLKQPQNAPMPVEEQVVAIYAGTKGYLDDLPVSEVRRFEVELIEYLKANKPGILEHIATSGTLPDAEDLSSALDEYAASFDPTPLLDQGRTGAGEAPTGGAGALDAESRDAGSSSRSPAAAGAAKG